MAGIVAVDSMWERKERGAWWRVYATGDGGVVLLRDGATSPVVRREGCQSGEQRREQRSVDGQPREPAARFSARASWGLRRCGRWKRARATGATGEAKREVGGVGGGLAVQGARVCERAQRGLVPYIAVASPTHASARPINQCTAPARTQ